MELFMDDFYVYGSSFDSCMINLEKVLERCVNVNLMLNWEKFHFIVKYGIVLSHLVSEKGTEVDRENIEVIKKLTHPPL